MRRPSASRCLRPLLALGLLLGALGVRAELVDRVAAVVNNEIITLGEVMKRASGDLQRADQETPPEQRAKKHEEITLKVLDAIIDDRLLDQEVKEAKITVDDKQIDLGVQDVMKRYNLNADQLAQAVANEGLTMTEYRQQMRNQLGRFQLMREKVAKLVKVTDADIRTEYDRMARDEGKEIEVHVRHIVVSVAENAPQPAVDQAFATASAIAAEARQPGCGLRRAGQEAEPGLEQRGRRGLGLLPARRHGAGFREGGLQPQAGGSLRPGAHRRRLARAQARRAARRRAAPALGAQAPNRGEAAPGAGRARLHPVCEVPAAGGGRRN